jgi:hypothetical protein
MAAMVNEHTPRGPTEEHLVEEIAGVLWRKRRLRMAEGAAHRDRLADTLSPSSDTAQAAVAHLGAPDQGGLVAEAIRATDAETAEAVVDVDEDTAMTNRALELLGAKGEGCYRNALAALREDTRGWWEEALAMDPTEQGPDEQPYAANALSLRRFLADEILPWLVKRRAQLVSRPLVREQALGESLNVFQLERLGRYEVHLDRKLERMLAMLYRLKDLRQQSRTQDS